MSGRRRELAGAVLLGAAALAGVLAVVAALTGGFRVHLLGIPISVRGEHRAATIALLCAVAGLALHTRARAGLLKLASARAVAPGLALALSIVILAIGLVHGTKTAAGSDVYGYVSQVPLWLSGELRIPQPMAATVPWPEPLWTFAPLGYRPGPDWTIVPTYAPGIPLLMALFDLVFGAGAGFWVTPLSGALVVLLTYAIGARISSPLIALAAACCVAANPLVLHMTVWLLGDLPAAALWMLALWLALRGTLTSAVLAGLTTAVAIVVRPNLVPLALFPALLLAREGWTSVPRLAAFALASTPGPVFVGWLFNTLYGSPFRSGYGENADLFQAAFVGTNTRQFTAWMWETQGPLLFLFPLAALVASAGRRVRLVLLAFVAAVVACYIAYQPFGAWWFLRFLLPAIPLMALLAVDGLAGIALRRGARARTVTVVLVTVLACAWGLRVAAKYDVLSIGRTEGRYARVGAYVARALPPDAMILTMQHSGTIRYYSGRQTLRWDYLHEEWLDRAVAHLEAAGHPVYLLLDEFEIPLVRERFASQAQIHVLDSPATLAPVGLSVWIWQLGTAGPQASGRRPVASIRVSSLPVSQYSLNSDGSRPHAPVGLMPARRASASMRARRPASARATARPNRVSR